MTELSLHDSLQKNEITLHFTAKKMKKFKLVKEKWYFQSLRETKSVKELDDWAVEISWYASTKDKDRWWDIVEPRAFQSAIERYMTNPIVLLQHKADKPIWIVESADIDENWLRIKAKISQNTDWVVDLIKNWVLRAFSIWYSVKDYETDVRELADGTYDMTNIIKDLELYEISVVSIPMNPYALSKSVEDLLEVEETEESDEADEDESEEENEVEAIAEVADEEKVEESENKSEEKREEKALEEWEETDESDEENHEWDNLQPEESEADTDVEETEESEKIDTEYVAEETADWSVAVEVKEEEAEEAKVEAVEETATEEADEQSEISEAEEIEEDSENAVESTADDEAIDETSNEEIIETKSIESESQKQFDFESKIAQLSKSFDEKLASKDEQIKELESKVERMTKLFAESLETIDRMTTAVKNTPVASWLSYKRPIKKWWYYDVASIIKSL